MNPSRAENVTGQVVQRAGISLLVVCGILAFQGCFSSATKNDVPQDRTSDIFVLDSGIGGGVGWPWHCEFSPNSRFLLSIQGGDRAEVYDLRAGHHAMLKAQSKPLNFQRSGTFSSDSRRIYTVLNDHLVQFTRAGKVWRITRSISLERNLDNLSTGRCPQTVAVSPDERTAAVVGLCGQDGGQPTHREVLIVDLTNGSVRVTQTKESVQGVWFTASSDLALTCLGDTLVLPREKGTPKRYPGIVHGLSPNRSLLLIELRPHAAKEDVLDSKEIMLSRFEIRRGLKGPPSGIFYSSPRSRGWTQQARFTGDDRLMVWVEGGSTTIRDTMSGKILQRITKYEGGRLVAASCSPDGRLLITGGRLASSRNGILKYVRTDR